MSTYMSAHPASWENIKTKKDLKERVKEKGDRVEFHVSHMMQEGLSTLAELPPGTILQVTNHPKRSWFASVQVVDGKVLIK